MTTAEGWMSVDGMRVYREVEDCYVDEDGNYNADLTDETEIIDCGNDEYATIE